VLAGIYDPDCGRVALRERICASLGSAQLFALTDVLAVIRDSAPGADPRRTPPSGAAIEGFVDNLPELAADLGLASAMGADSVAAHAFARWGEQMLPRLRGDFALVVWEQEGRRLLLAQDQVGVGALFYVPVGRGMRFASEIHDLLSLLPRAPGPDEDTLIRYLASEDALPGATFYEGVRRLGAGHRMLIDDLKVEVRRYRRVPYRAPLCGSRLEVAAQLRDALIDAVEVRTRGARRVGITLSGGFDSSVVAAAAATVLPRIEDIRGYSAVFPGIPAMDDRDHLDVLVRALSLTNPRYANEPGGALETAVAYTRAFRLPLIGPGWVTEIPLLRRAQADAIDVLLDGQGGDETFGSAPFLVADELRRGNLPGALGLIRGGFQGAWRGVSARRAAQLLFHYGIRPQIPPRLRRQVRTLRDVGHYAPAHLTRPAARQLVDGSDDFMWAGKHDGPLWWSHLRYLLIDRREDAGLGDYIRHRSRWFGLRGRPPLFDLALTEMTLQIPPEMRFDTHLDRPIGREAVAGLLPDEIRLSHRKSNLAPFYLRGLTGSDLPIIAHLLGAPALEIGRWVRPETLSAMLERPPRAGDPGRSEWMRVIWACASAELWLRQRRDPDLTGVPAPAPLRSAEV
jgi:asparagine synthase (glutamine-hydrolysing)